jgi:predicted permease
MPFTTDLTQACRQIRSARVWAFTVVVTLGLAVGATATVFSLIDAILFRAFPFPDTKSLVFLWGGKDQQVRSGISGPDLEDWRRANHSFTNIGGFIPTGKARVGFGGGQDPEYRSVCVDSEVFDVLGTRPYLGILRNDGTIGGLKTAVLSYQLWNNEFGANPAVVGRTIRVDNDTYVISAIMPRGFFFPDTDTQLWLSAPCGLKGLDNRATTMFNAIARLAPGVTVEQANQDVDTITSNIASRYPATNRDRRGGVYSLRATIVGESGSVLWLLFAAVGVALLIACLNVGHLQLTRARQRESEFAIRTALGATPRMIIRQLVTEHFLLACVAAVLAVLVCGAGHFVLNRLELYDLPRFQNIGLTTRVLWFTCLLSIGSASLAAIWPGLKAATVPPARILALNAPPITAVRRSAGGAFAVSQIAAAFALLVVASALTTSFAGVLNAQWGFEPEHLTVLRVRVPPEFRADVAGTIRWSNSVVARLKQLPGVAECASSYNAPLSWTSWKPTTLAINGEIVTKGWLAATWVVGPDYFKAAGIPLTGREFTSEDSAATEPVVVLSESLAKRLAPSGNAIGMLLQLMELKTINGQPSEEYFARQRRGDSTVEYDPAFLTPVEDKEWRVIGIARDVRMFTLDLQPQPALYITAVQNPSSIQWKQILATTEAKFLVRTRDLRATSLLSAIKEQVLSVNSTASILEISVMSDLVRRSVGGRGERILTAISFVVFGCIGLTCASLGVYAVVADVLRARTREYAVRIAVGATPMHIIRHVGGYVSSILAGGLAIGVPAAIILSRVARSSVIGMESQHPSSYITAVLVVSAMVALVSLRPIWVVFDHSPGSILRS